MNDLIQALDRCADSGNWYGALFVALSLPDICGRIDRPGLNGSQRRYAEWFDKYVRARYTFGMGQNEEEKVFLGGSDCYALRCSYLHEGGDDISLQRAEQAVEKFLFIVAPKGCTVHCNMINTKLQLQVDIFCRDIKEGVLNWLREIEANPQKLEATKGMLQIQYPDSNGCMRI